MKRTGFRRRERPTAPAHDREARLEARAARTMAEARPRAAVVTVVSAAPAPAIPKAEPLRSEPYRRLVAMFPCKFCGIAGYSQAAHPNTGKGAGTKTDDRLCFPLCCDRPGQRGCHSLFDQGALLGKEARRAIEPAWAADTQRQIQMQGLWPKKLPFPGKED